MEKYMVGSNIIGYNPIDIKDLQRNISNSVVVVVITDENINIPLYYRFIKNSIINNNKVIIVSTVDNEQFRTIAALVISLGDYDVYNVKDRETITAGYIESIENRKPELCEVQQFIGGDITAYSHMTEIIITIQNMIDDGEIDKLKDYIERNKETIESFVTSMDIMKKNAEIANSGELSEQITSLKNDVKKLENDIIDAKAAEAEAKKSMVESENALRQANVEKKALMDRVENLEEQLKSGTSAITYYNEINLAYTKHNIQRVLYFKEISYVPHTMSMIRSIYELLSSARKMNVKFVIYDSSTEIYEPYIESNIKVINSKNYSINKPVLTGKNSCLISEPNPAITNDLISVADGFDVLIIYDRMHRYENILTGNNVTRIIVTSSSSEFDAVRKKLNITVGDMILTSRNSKIHDNKDMIELGNIIDIEEIQGYSSNSDSAKVAKYSKMQCISGERLLQKIFSVSNIDAMFK